MTPDLYDKLGYVLRTQCRLYNSMLEGRIEAYKERGETVTFAQQSKALTALRAERPDWAAINRTIQVATLRRLDNAYKAFFRRVKEGKEKSGFPGFKPSARWDTLECTNNVQARTMLKVDGRTGRLNVKGLGALKFRIERELPSLSHLAGFKICRKPSRVEVQLVCNSEVDDPVMIDKPVAPVGIDVGVKYQLTCSDGMHMPGRSEDHRRTKRLQRLVSRAKKGSNSRRKKIALLAKEQARIAASRKGQIHELSTELVNDYDFVAVEDLQIKNMTKSAKGTVENPGKNVKAKAGLNRSILEQGWGTLTHHLEYKTAEVGTSFVKVDPKNTSQECSGCGVVVKKGLSVRIHKCPQCGLTLDRDVNAARNILERGLAALSAGS